MADDHRRDDLILDAITEGVFTVDLDLNVQTFNRAAERITGLDRDRAVGQKCYDVLRASVCQSDCPMARALKTGRPVLDRSVDLLDTRGRTVPVRVRSAPLRDQSGRVRGGVETFVDLTALVTLKKRLQRTQSPADMIGRSPAMAELFALLPRVADSESTVLITGASGTGKGLLARIIHQASARKPKPFVVMGCGAVPETLLESELFGYRRGAFTGADRDKPGLLAEAQGGTLFLDEVGELTPAVQVKLLRVLDEKQYVPLGTSTPLKADVRLIAATNRRLEDDVQAGRFRQDLYYRLNVVRLRLPPLSERREDIPPLVDHFLSRLRAETGKVVSAVSDEAMARLLNWTYPGNVRELYNVLEHAVVLCPGERIEVEHLPAEVRADPEAAELTPPADLSLADLEARAIAAALDRHHGHRARTARALGISTSTLWRKMKRYGLE